MGINELSEEDFELLRESATRFFAEQMPVAAIREIRDQPHPQGFDNDLWQGMVGMGWSGILVSEDDGGLGMGHRSMGVIMEAAGHNLAASPLLSTAVMSACLLGYAGSREQRARDLPALVDGSLLATLAVDEHRRHRPTDIRTHAERKGDEFILNGTKTFVLDGHVANRLFVVARTAGEPGEELGLSIFNLDAKTQGITITRTHMVDGRNAANITLEDVKCSEDDLIGEQNGAFAVLDKCLDAARVALAAEMLGGIDEAFQRTVEYLKLRTQFDVPIGSFQALKHRAATMFCEIELTRAAVLDAQLALDENHDSAPRLASLAKAKASSTFELVSNEALQMHGGIGMTDEEEIGLFLKRARVAQQAFGDYDYHSDRYAQRCGF